MMSHSNYMFFLSLSSFPLLSTISFFSFFMGAFFSFKFNFTLLFLSVISSMSCGIVWWLAYSLESYDHGVFNYNLSMGLKFSFLLFISSEIFFFFSFFWSFFHFFLSPISDLGFNWPPYSIIMFEFLEIPLLNTMILLSSGLSVTCSHYFFSSNKIISSFFYLFLTLVLGLFFSYFQFLEYCSSFFCFNDSCFGCCFFILTGFHGVHVVVGSFFLFFVFVRYFFSSSSINISPLSFDLSSWYWHFVDVVWIFLYFLFYVYSCS